MRTLIRTVLWGALIGGAVMWLMSPYSPAPKVRAAATWAMEQVQGWLPGAVDETEARQHVDAMEQELRTIRSELANVRGQIAKREQERQACKREAERFETLLAELRKRLARSNGSATVCVGHRQFPTAQVEAEAELLLERLGECRKRQRELVAHVEVLHEIAQKWELTSRELTTKIAQARREVEQAIQKRRLVAVLKQTMATTPPETGSHMEGIRRFTEAINAEWKTVIGAWVRQVGESNDTLSGLSATRALELELSPPKPIVERIDMALQDGLRTAE